MSAQSRWLQRPRLHVPGSGPPRKVGWLELFYDLIYVAAFVQLGSALGDHVGLAGFALFAALMVPLWFTWTGFTFFTNRFLVDDAPHRLLVFLQMLAVGAVAVSVTGVFEGEPRTFALAYGCARVCTSLFYLRAFRQVLEAREMSRRYWRGFLLGASLWLASAWLPTPWTYFLWALAMAVDLSVPLGRPALALVERYPPDLAHVTERFGLLTLIVLGESFVKALSELAERGLTLDSGALAVLGLVVTWTLWWIYFDDVAGSRIKGRPLAAVLWVYGHLPLAISVTAVGVAIKKVVGLGVLEAGAAAHRWFLCGSLALALLSVAFIDWLTERRHAQLSDAARVQARVGSAALVLVLGLAGGYLPAGAFLLLVVVVSLAQVGFDLGMAPLAEDAHHHDHANASPAAPAPPGTPSAPGSRVLRDLRPAVRLGTPSEFRRDLYFHFIEGSWLRLLSSLAVIYLMGNVVFATLYVLDPGGIANARPGVFIDAFFFSVQTMSTVGYGALAPSSTYVNALVTVQVALSLVGVAVVTGVVFAKIARPRSSVMFSDVMVVTRRHGQRVLMFRVANARGNDVVEANLRVSVLKDEVSPEGHRLRRLHDLSLERSSQPLFTLSWLVSHVIDDRSPLLDVNAANAGAQLRLFVCTMTGYDGTYATTIHARKTYFPEDLRFGHRFVDVISDLPDGRLQIDHDRLHHTLPDGTEDSPASDAG